jgi:hypothetical protein
LAVIVWSVTVSVWLDAGRDSVALSCPTPVVADNVCPFPEVAVSVYCVAPRPAFQVKVVLPPAIFPPGGGVKMLAAVGRVTIIGADVYCETLPAVPAMTVM